MRTAAPRVSGSGSGAGPLTEAPPGGRRGLAGAPCGAGGWGGAGPGAAASGLRSRPPPGPLRSRVLGGRDAWGAAVSSRPWTGEEGHSQRRLPPLSMREEGSWLPPLPSQYPNGSASLGWQEGCGRGRPGLGGGGECGFVSSQCHPRVLHLLLAWSAHPLGWRRARGRELGRWARGAWVLFPRDQMRGWLLLGIPAPGSQGSSQGLVFRATASLGIFP